MAIGKLACIHEQSHQDCDNHETYYISWFILGYVCVCMYIMST